MPTPYTVEMVASPVLDDDWDRYYDLLDLFPGTILIQDPVEPSLIFSLETEHDDTAYSFVRLIVSLMGIHHTKICVTLADRVDFDYEREEYAESI